MKPKTKNIIVWILAGLLAFAFAAAGITKLLGVEMQIKNLESWGYPLWFRFPIGLAEVVFAVALLFQSIASWQSTEYLFGQQQQCYHIQGSRVQQDMGRPTVLVGGHRKYFLLRKTKTKRRKLLDDIHDALPRGLLVFSI